MAEEGVEGEMLSKERQLPPEVYPKKLSKTAPVGDYPGHPINLLRLDFERQQQNDWANRWRGKIPQEWENPGTRDPSVLSYIRETPGKDLLEKKVLLEAIVTYNDPLYLNDLASKVPLDDVRLLALGLVNSGMINTESGHYFATSWEAEPKLKMPEAIREAQLKFGVKPETLEKAERQAAEWDKQRERC